MVQRIITAYGALNTSSLQNDRFAKIIVPGIYTGFFVRPNLGAPNKLDIIAGLDATSTLVTQEGVRIEETENVFAAVTVGAADANLTRYDLLVGEYTYTTSTTATLVYSLIRGKNQKNLDTEPELPTVVNQAQTPLAYIKVRPQLSFSSTLSAQIAVTDVIQVPRANTLKGAEGISSVKPIVAPTDDRRIYVFPGSMANAEGTRILSFLGAYSEPIEEAAWPESAERYVMYGLSDAGSVLVMGTAVSRDALPDISNDLFPLAIARAKKIAGTIRLISSEDIRIPFARRVNTSDKSINYHALLSNSVFQHLRIEAFEDESGIDLSSVATVSGNKDNLVATINGVDNALTIEWTGSSAAPAEDVVITTTDLMSGGNLGSVKHLMVVAESDVDLVSFQYSGSSAGTGFVTASSSFSKIVRTSGAGIRKLFLKLYIPASGFIGSKKVKINSIGVLFTLTDAVFNTLSLNDLGLLSFTKVVPNLIANGDFSHWSKLTTAGRLAIPDADTEQVFSFTPNSPAAADGWMATTMSLLTKGETISRVIRTVETGSLLPALKITTSVSSTGSIVLEYRVPAAYEMVGSGMTFGIDYTTDSPSNLSIGIAYLSVQDDETQVISKFTTQAVRTSGELLVSSTAVGAAVNQVSFFITISATGSELSHILYNARAAVGFFTSLEYNKAPDAAITLRQYYEKGRAFASGRAGQGNVIGTATQFGSPKAVELGELVAQIVPNQAADRSSGVGAVVLDADKHGILVTATPTSQDFSVVDVDWEVFVKYRGVIS